MPIGTRMGSLKTLKATMAKGGGGGAFIKYIPKNSSMNVRFIQEPEEWVNYVEHYDTVLRRSFPCNGEQSCPGCTSDARKSNRYLANAVEVDTDRVIPLQMPKDLANRLVVRYERNGTLTDRDFELSRSGEGLDTVYDLDAMIVDRKKIDKYQPLDLLKVLEDAYQSVFGESSDTDASADDEGPGPTPSRPTRRRSKAAQVLDQQPEVDTGDDEDVDLTPYAGEDPADVPVFDPATGEEPARDDDPADEGDDDDGEGYDEETLKAMPLGALRAVARQFGVNPKGKSQTVIVAEIMATGTPVDPEDPPF